jgi:hypothetical protein
MKNAASHPNFYAKISGLGTTVNNPNGWTAEDVRPYIEFAIEQFGENRCFCGGDWPVSLLAGSYSKSWTIYHSVLSELLDEKGCKKLCQEMRLNSIICKNAYLNYGCYNGGIVSRSRSFFCSVVLYTAEKSDTVVMANILVSAGFCMLVFSAHFHCVAYHS